MPPDHGPSRPPLPRLPAALLRALLPYAERDEVLADLADEYTERVAARGPAAARAWAWRQVLGSVPALLRRGWWRGWSGFEPRANRMRPGGPMFESWIMDVRFAARRLRTRPTYALLAVLTLALGIGGTAAIYGIARGLLLDPLPYRAEEEVAVFWFDRSWTEEEFLHLRGRFPGFREVAAYRSYDATLERGDAPARVVPGLASSAEVFSVLGARPMLGRGFQAGDDVTGAEDVVVISHGLWQELGGDPSVIGQRLQMDGTPQTVVGVMPRGFWFPDPTVRVWFPVAMSPERRSGQYTFIGRVAQGQQVENMAAPLAQLRTMLAERFTYNDPQWDKTKEPKLTPVREFLVGPLQPALVATLAAMGLILLIACANVAALMLGQVEGRSTELAVRSALGADRARLTQQLVAEAVLVGAIAGVVGAGLAAAAFRVLVGALPLGAWAESASLDWSVFGVAMVIAVLAALLVALIPVISLWRGDLRAVIGSARTGGVAGRGSRLESGLVVAEVALAVLMAAGAALLIRSVSNLYAIDPGVDTKGVAVLHVALPPSVPRAQRQQTIRELTEALAAVPGARSAAATHRLPLSGGGDNWGMSVEGKPDLEQSTTAYRIVTPGYFQTLGIAVKDGRVFDSSDRPEGDTVTVVNEALVRKYFPEGNPIGRRISNGVGGMARIIGVVQNAAEAKLTDEPIPTRYMLYEQLPYAPRNRTFVVRTARPEDAVAVLDAARRAIQRVAPGAGVQEATTMERVLDRAMGPVRQVVNLVTLLTALALVLGAVGIYGVMSHFTTRRKRDWGIRIALGLAPSRVVTHIVGRGVALVAVGVVLGIAGIVVLARLLASMLYGVGTTDPIALAAATAALVAVGVLSAWLPAHRASRTDPVIVLREQ